MTRPSQLLPLLAFLAIAPSCAFLKETGVDKALPKLVEAVPDILTDIREDGGLRKHVENNMCEIYSQRGRGFAELAWMHDWPAFDPLFRSTPDPSADEAYCRKLVTDRGAAFVYKGEGGHGGTALRYVVALPSNYEKRAPVVRAALMCHEAAHIVWQHRVGIEVAAIDYATVSGRVAAEAVGYTVTEAMQRRHGWRQATILDRRAKRIAGFAKRYRLGNTITDECLGGFFVGTSEAFQERSGLSG